MQIFRRLSGKRNMVLVFRSFQGEPETAAHREEELWCFLFIYSFLFGYAVLFCIKRKFFLKIFAVGFDQTHAFVKI